MPETGRLDSRNASAVAEVGRSVESLCVERPPERRILRPGRNHWRMPAAHQVAVLVDAAAYFAELDSALRTARRSILIVGWDFDGRIALRPPSDGGQAEMLRDVLRNLVEARPDLEVRILVWNVAPVHAPSAAMPLLFGAEWQDHPRIHLRLDAEHPLYGAHHQKLVCIDDAIAFVGGIDLTVDRWDTSVHAADQPVRSTPDGEAYGPVHDVQVAVDGDAAVALGDLARTRWQFATGERLEPVRADAAAWPDGLAPDFVDVPLAIARTAPAWGDRPAVREAAALNTDALAGARRCIYIEMQYFASTAVGDVLERSLSRVDGPDVVVLTTLSMHGMLEKFAMGENRDRLIRRLKAADRHDRLRVYHPVVPAAAGDCEVLVHSKLVIVDDDFVRIGSSNFNNRSIGLDTECDVAIEATDEATRRTIAGLRARLLGEHLGADPETVARAATLEGSLVRAVERLNGDGDGRCLRPHVAMSTAGPKRPMFGTRLLDPVKPFEPLWFLRRRRGRRTGT